MCYVIYKDDEEVGAVPVCYLHDKQSAQDFVPYVQNVEQKTCTVVPMLLADAVRQKITYFAQVLDKYTAGYNG